MGLFIYDHEFLLFKHIFNFIILYFCTRLIGNSLEALQSLKVANVVNFVQYGNVFAKLAQYHLDFQVTLPNLVGITSNNSEKVLYQYYRYCNQQVTTSIDIAMSWHMRFQVLGSKPKFRELGTKFKK